MHVEGAGHPLRRAPVDRDRRRRLVHALEHVGLLVQGQPVVRRALELLVEPGQSAFRSPRSARAVASTRRGPATSGKALDELERDLFGLLDAALVERRPGQVEAVLEGVGTLGRGLLEVLARAPVLAELHQQVTVVEVREANRGFSVSALRKAASARSGCPPSVCATPSAS